MTNPHSVHKFTLGQRVRCTVTGFVGITIARVDHLNGCVQYCVKPPIPKDKPHERPDGYYIDEETLDLVDEGILEQGHRHPAPDALSTASVGGPSHREGELPR